MAISFFGGISYNLIVWYVIYVALLYSYVRSYWPVALFDNDISYMLSHTIEQDPLYNLIITLSVLVDRVLVHTFTCDNRP
jgi:hypothetical protein